MAQDIEVRDVIEKMHDVLLGFFLTHSELIYESFGKKDSVITVKKQHANSGP